MIALTLALAAIQPHNPIGTTINVRGAGLLSCATAFKPENRTATENFIAGYWAAWDMARIKEAAPLASSSDLAGITGEVERECRERPSSPLWVATLEARNAVAKRERPTR